MGKDLRGESVDVAAGFVALPHRRVHFRGVESGEEGARNFGLCRRLAFTVVDKGRELLGVRGGRRVDNS